MKEKDENANGEAERKKMMRKQRKEEKKELGDTSSPIFCAAIGS